MALTVLTFAVVAGWTAESARANAGDALATPGGDPHATRAVASFDQLAGVDGESFVTSHASVIDEDIAYDGEIDACSEAGRCGNACIRPGLFQNLHGNHPNSEACWIGRTDALVLWRDAPPDRSIVESGDSSSTPILNANQLQSTATGGVRASVLRVDRCDGDAWEGSYIYAGKFTSRRELPASPDFAYALAPPGIYGNNESQPFDSGTTTLLARLQGAELNRHFAGWQNLRWLAGFRWVQWHERFTLQDTLVNHDPPINDVYRTTCDNNLYGGQIGADARVLTLGWFRLDSVVKAGAYYNNAVQTSIYTTDDPANPGTASVTVGQSPAACSFVGEVGFTGVLPLARNLDVRFGYLGLWLTGLAQPTQQLSGQQVTPRLPSEGTITTNGGALLQGMTLGLEGRW